LFNIEETVDPGVRSIAVDYGRKVVSEKYAQKPIAPDPIESKNVFTFRWLYNWTRHEHLPQQRSAKTGFKEQGRSPLMDAVSHRSSQDEPSPLASSQAKVIFKNY
jgi:hypothetical protein